MKRIIAIFVGVLTFGVFNSFAGGPYTELSEAQKEKAKLDREGEIADDGVILQSADGSYFVIKVREAKKSETLKSLIEDAGVEDPLPLPNVKGKELRYIVAWMEGGEHWKNVFEEFKKEKMSVARDMLLAANFMDIPLLFVNMQTVYLDGLDNTMKKLSSKKEWDTYKAEYINKLPKDIRKLLVKKLLWLWTPLVGVLSQPSNEHNFKSFRFSPNSQTILTTFETRHFIDNAWHYRVSRMDLWKVAIDRNSKPMQTVELGNTDSHMISPRGNWVVSDRPSALSEPVKEMLTSFSRPRFADVPKFWAKDVFSPQGTRFLSCNTTPASLWNLESPTQYPKARLPMGMWQICSKAKFIGEETWVISEGSPGPGLPGGIALWDAHAETKGLVPRPTTTFGAGRWGQSIEAWDISPDGEMLATTRDDYGPPRQMTTKLWKIEARENPQPIATLADTKILGFSPDSKRMVTLMGKRTDTDQMLGAALWDLTKPHEPRMIASTEGQIFSVRDTKAAFSPDGRTVAIGPNRSWGKYRSAFGLFPLESGAKWKAYAVDLGQENVEDFDFSPDSKWMTVEASAAQGQGKKIYLFARDWSELDLAGAQLIAWVILKTKTSGALPVDLGRRRSDFPPFVREALAEDPYADALLFGPQRETGEPEHKKPKPSDS